MNKQFSIGDTVYIPSDDSLEYIVDMEKNDVGYLYKTCDVDFNNDVFRIIAYKFKSLLGRFFPNIKCKHRLAGEMQPCQLEMVMVRNKEELNISLVAKAA